MKKLVPLLVLVIAAGGYFYFSQNTRTPTSPGAASSTSPQRQPATGGEEKPSTFASEPVAPKAASMDPAGMATQGDEQEPAARPLTEAYTSAEDALAAVLKGAKDYDDSVLEQFTTPDENCSWCPEFYTSVRGLITN